MRKEALTQLYKSVADRLTIDCDTYINALNDWEVWPLIQNNEILGAVIVKENELHIGYGTKPKGSIRRHIREPLAYVLNKYGHAITYVQKDNKLGLNFCKRLGFVELSTDSVKILLRCERSDYV